VTVRALIIAIENYPDVATAGMAKTLDGTLQAGLDVKAWLEDKWRKEHRPSEDTHLIFCSEPQQPGGKRARRDDIHDAIDELSADGPNTTEDLYFFFSGHGFAFIDRPGNTADVIVTADFKDQRSGPSCFRLDEIVHRLRTQLGGRCHYYFIDACRNPLSSRDVQVPLQFVDNVQAGVEASTFILQSTRRGDVAAVGGPFASALVAGLRGAGKAKVWDDRVGDGMAVRYDSLRSYVSSFFAGRDDQRISHRTDGTVGENETLLTTVTPVPELTCIVELENVTEANGSLIYRRGRETQVTKVPLSANPTALRLTPERYFISAHVTKNGLVEHFAQQNVELYDDTKIVLKAAPQSHIASSGGLERTRSPTLSVVVPAGASVEFQELSTGRTEHLNASGRIALPNGRYLSTLRDRNATILRRQELEIDSTNTASIDIANWHGSVPHEAIAETIARTDPNARQALEVEFSEALGGPLADTDLNVWLAILGGARIIGRPGEYHKLSQFPLHDFSSEAPGASPFYILAGLEGAQGDEDAQGGLEIMATDWDSGARSEWTKATEPHGLPGIRHAYVKADPGSALVSFRITGATPIDYTIASAACSNCATLITLTLDDRGAPRIGQYLLPISHLKRFYDDKFPLPSHRNMLDDIRFMAQAIRICRKRRDLTKEMPAAKEAMADAQHGKWLDPIGCSLVVYEFLRRGNLPAFAEVAHTMLKYFPDLPDSAVLARRAGIADVPEPAGPPLFFDGYRMVQDRPGMMPLPASHLDFESPWTAWLATPAQ
jgi:hypothetical protein